jgi:HAD superfamily hydrolase (TIGR01549 family)
LYDRGLLDRSVIRYQRFKMIFESIQIQHDEIAARLSAGYISLSPTKSHLVEGALELLDYLKNRYPLYVITNGFTEMQTTKARSGGIENYFQSIVTSEMAGYKKPAKEIFDFALSRSGFNHHEAIMIGDNLLTDIAGAFQAGIDTVHFLPQHRLTPEGGIPNGQEESQITHQISKLIELKEIL